MKKVLFGIVLALLVSMSLSAAEFTIGPKAAFGDYGYAGSDWNALKSVTGIKDKLSPSFAGGVFFGVGSLVLLAFNGLAIGTISGHFANVGLLGYLLEFIVGHGVLELFAIWVAGAAGFLLGKSLIAPGQVTRSDALVVNGRLAVRMVGAATLLLLVAGVIEGFISAGEKDLLFRIAISGASILLLVAYLLNGARYVADLKERIQPSER